MGLLSLLSGVADFVISHIGTVILIMIFAGIVTFLISGIIIENSQVTQYGIPKNSFNVLSGFWNWLMSNTGMQ